MNERNNEYLYITTCASGKKFVVEKLLALSLDLYYTNIRIIKSHAIVNQKFISPSDFIIWHNRLGYPRAIMI